MTRHFNRQADKSPSQSFPSAESKAASDVTLADTSVLLCDWHGKIVWKSAVGERVKIGVEIWQFAASRAKDSLKAAIASVVTLRENSMLEVETDRNEHFRLWMWPLNDPEFAICILALRIPGELALLTDREKACLKCLAQGKSTRDISEELEIGVTTVHTHLRRSREKLGLTSGEALIGFAARYFFVPPALGSEVPPVARKRSG